MVIASMSLPAYSKQVTKGRLVGVCGEVIIVQSVKYDILLVEGLICIVGKLEGICNVLAIPDK